MIHPALGTRAGWEIHTPPPDTDPFLSATLWALDRPYPVIITGPDARKAHSVHARTLLEGAIPLDGTHPGPLIGEPGLAVVLAMPTPTQLESLRTSRFHADARWFLLPSTPGTTDREYQDAWLWAHQRPAPPASTRSTDLSTIRGILSDVETWALLVRADDDRAAALRDPRPRRLWLLPRATS
jgi:hypothetical protein